MNRCKPKKPVYHYFHLKTFSEENIKKLKEFVKECCSVYEVYEFRCKQTNRILYSIRSDFHTTENCSLFEDVHVVHKYSFKNGTHDFFVYDSIDFNNIFEKIRTKVFPT